MLTDSEGNPLNMDNLQDVSDPNVTPVEPTQDPAATTDPISTDPSGTDPADTTDPTAKPADGSLGDGDDSGVDPDKIDITPDPDDDPADYSDTTNPGDEEVVYKGIADILISRGILAEPEEPITSESALVERFESEVDARVDERVKKVEQYMQSGIPFEEVAKIQSSITQAESITPELLEQEEIARSLIVSDMQQKGMSAEEAVDYYELVKAAGSSSEKAAIALDRRKELLSTMLDGKVSEIQQAKADQLEKRAADAQRLADEIKRGEVFDKKLSASTIDKMLSTLNTVVAKHPTTGEPLNAYMKFKLENPVDFEKKVLYLYTLTNGFSNLKSFERSAETRISRKFRDAMTSLSAPTKSFGGDSSSPSKFKIDPDTIDDIVDPA